MAPMQNSSPTCKTSIFTRSVTTWYPLHCSSTIQATPFVIRSANALHSQHQVAWTHPQIHHYIQANQRFCLRSRSMHDSHIRPSICHASMVLIQTKHKGIMHDFAETDFVILPDADSSFNVTPCLTQGYWSRAIMSNTTYTLARFHDGKPFWPWHGIVH